MTLDRFLHSEWLKYTYSTIDIYVLVDENFCNTKILEWSFKYSYMLTKEDKQDFNNIGTSVHSLEDLEKAISLGVTYVLAGHIYDTDCKKGLPGRGLDFLQQICNNVRVPVIAIGGINMDRLKEVKDVGASGAAIMSGYMNK